MGLTWWVATTRKGGPAYQSRNKTGRGRLWKRRSVEKSFGLSHLAWESRPNRGIPTSHSHDGGALSTSNRTYRVLKKADILTCYGHLGGYELAELGCHRHQTRRTTRLGRT